MISKKEHCEVEAHFLKEDLLTDELTQELIRFSANNNLGILPNNKFEYTCIHIFLSGRKFANYKQLDQYVTVFLESWNSLKYIDGNSFCCFYAKSKKDQYQSVEF